ncbi:MAG: glycosyltransferase [Candidatus Paceibacterota bacterium]
MKPVPRRSHKTLFISRDGKAQPYLESLFIPILAGLDRPVARSTILEFCPAGACRESKELADKHGIPLHLRRYHGSLLGGMFDACRAFFVIERLVRKDLITVLHARSYIPGISALFVKLVHPSVRIVFDSDGLMPDEQKERRGWGDRHIVYRGFRWIERRLISAADAVVVRTFQAKKILRARNPNAASGEKYHVISNGKDTSVFRLRSEEERREVRRRLGIDEGAFLVLYAGSIGPNYLPHEMFRFFAELRSIIPDAHFLVVTTEAREQLLRTAAYAQVPEKLVTISSLPHAEMPPVIASADLGLSFRKSGLSRRAVCPLKVAEYLLCGVPVVTNEGVGDLDRIFSRDTSSKEVPIGCVLSQFSAEEIKETAHAVKDMLSTQRLEVRARARCVGVHEFDIRDTVKGYVAAYQSLPALSSRKSQ